MKLRHGWGTRAFVLMGREQPHDSLALGSAIIGHPGNGKSGSSACGEEWQFERIVGNASGFEGGEG